MASVIQELIKKIEVYGITVKNIGRSVGKADKAKRSHKSLAPQ